MKLRRLHGIAQAALEGSLDAGALRCMEPEQAMAQLRQLDGIGPFYAALVMVRASGLSDLLPSEEPKFKALAAEL